LYLFFVINSNSLTSTSFNSTKNITTVKIQSTSSVTTTKLTTAEKILFKEPQHVNLILDKLRDEQANKCEYGSNPRVFDICKDIDTSIVANYHLENIRLDDIVNIIIKENVVVHLQKKCKLGEWCFTNADHISKHPLGKNLIKKHSHMLCLFGGCFNKVERYVNNCVPYELSRNVLKTVPALCDSEGKENQYCLESALQLYHVSAATFEMDKNGTLINNCEYKLKNEKSCHNECKTLAMQVNKLDSCCLNTSLIKNFEPLNWVTDISNNAETFCDLPLTSLCFGQGKYYIGIGPSIVVLAVIITVFSMSMFFACLYTFVINNQKEKPYYTDAVSYSKLNNNVEEEMNLVQADESDLSFRYFDSEKYDKVSQQGISRFINQHNSDVQDLLN